jgi:hypothetical protein
VVNSNESGRGWRGGRRIVALAVLASACGAVLFGSAGTASASSVVCGGKLAPLNKKAPSIDAKIDFTCTEDIRGFSVITNKTFDFFGTEMEVFEPSGAGSSESATIQCEGNVPGPGFGCGVTNRNTPAGSTPGGGCEAVTGSTSSQAIGPPCTTRMSAGNRGEMQVGFPVSPCKPAGPFAPGKDKLRVWLSVLTEPLIGSFNAAALNQTAYTRGTYISAPFRLKIAGYNNCSVPEPKKAKGKKASSAGTSNLGTVISVW